MPPRTKLTAETIRKTINTIPAIENLFGTPAVSERDNPYNISVERTTLDTIAMGEMLRQGISVADIVDPEKLKEKRLAEKNHAADVLRECRKLGDFQKFAELAADNLTLVLEKFTEHYAKKVGAGTRIEDLLLPENRSLAAVVASLTDAAQEIVKVPDFFYRNHQPGEMDRLINRQMAVCGNYGVITGMLGICASMLETQGTPRMLADLAKDVVPYLASTDEMYRRYEKEPGQVTQYETTMEISGVYSSALAQTQDAGPSLDAALREIMKEPAGRELFIQGALDGSLKQKFFRGEGMESTLRSPEELLAMARDFVPGELRRMQAETAAKTATTNFGILPTEEEKEQIKLQPNPLSLSAGRGALSSLALFRMLKDHPEYDVDDVLSDRFAEDRKTYGNQVLQNFMTCAKAQKGPDPKAAADKFGKYAAEGYFEGLQRMVDYVSARVAGIRSIGDLALPQNRNLMSAITFLTEAIQEIDRAGVRERLNTVPGFTPEKLNELKTTQMLLCSPLSHPQKIMFHTENILADIESGAPGAASRGAHTLLSNVFPSMATINLFWDKTVQNPQEITSMKVQTLGSMQAARTNDELDALRNDSNLREILEEKLASPDSAREFLGELLKDETQKMIFHAGSDGVDVDDILDYFDDREELRLRREVERWLKSRGEGVLDAEGILKAGFLGNGEGHVYSPDPEKEESARDVLKQVVSDIRENKEVLFSGINPETHENVSYKLSLEKGVVRVRETKMISPLERDRLLELAQRFKKEVEASGVTRNDSDEFTAFRENCLQAADKLSKTLSADEINKTVNKLCNSADAYYRAKIGEDKNSRRQERFDLAAEVRNLQQKERKSEIDILKDQIAGKSVAAYCMALQASGREADQRLADRVMNNRQNFDLAVSRVRASEAFQASFGNKQLPQLKKDFAKSGSRLVVNLITPEKAREFFAPERQPNNPQSGPQAK